RHGNAAVGERRDNAVLADHIVCRLDQAAVGALAKHSLAGVEGQVVGRVRLPAADAFDPHRPGQHGHCLPQEAAKTCRVEVDTCRWGRRGYHRLVSRRAVGCSSHARSTLADPRTTSLSAPHEWPRTWSNAVTASAMAVPPDCAPVPWLARPPRQ